MRSSGRFGPLNHSSHKKSRKSSSPCCFFGSSTPAAGANPAAPVDQAQVERSHMDQLSLQNILMPSEMRAPHSTRLVTVGEAPFYRLSPSPQQTLAIHRSIVLLLPYAFLGGIGYRAKAFSRPLELRVMLPFYASNSRPMTNSLVIHDPDPGAIPPSGARGSVADGWERFPASFRFSDCRER